MRSNFSATFVGLALAIAETAVPVMAAEDHDTQTAQAPVKQESKSDAQAKDILKLATNGNARAQLELAEMYEKGEGVPVDLKEAEKWYEKAAFSASKRDYKETSSNLSGPGNAKRALAECKEKADKGDPEAQVELASRYAHGANIKADLSKAAEYYGLAANQGNAAAQTSLGYMYEHGEGVEKDSQKAIELYKKAAGQHYAGALNNLGVMQANGVSAPRNYAEAVKYFEEAAAQGDAHAQCNLGWMYQVGRGVERDYSKAVTLYQKAAAHGMAAARYNLGYLYQCGRGVAVDLEKSEKLYALATAEQEAGAKLHASVNEAEDALGFMCQLGQLVSGPKTE